MISEAQLCLWLALHRPELRRVIVAELGPIFRRLGVDAKEFVESDHPRDADGKFSSGGGGTGSASKSLDEVLGKEITGVKGQKAIDAIVSQKSGHVKGAFYRDEVGDIDVAWGDESFGLCHIIKRRKEQGVSTPRFLAQIGKVIERGDATWQENGRLRIRHKGYTAIVEPEFKNRELTMLLTAFKKD